MNIDQFFEVIGPLTNRPSPEGKVIETQEFENYVQQKVSYLVESNERINAYICIPKYINSKMPAIICHHQHSSKYNQAKSEMVGLIGDPDLAYAKELACAGFITLSADSIAFEDRNWNNESWWGTEYYELVTRIIKGRTLIEKVLSDISAGINYLASRSEVNIDKIGFIGHSYGGRMAVWSPVYDRRIKVSVSNCFCKNIKNSIPKDKKTRIPMEYCVPNILKYGDVEDVVRLINPCHLYLSATKDDKWSKDAELIYNYAKDSFIDSEIKLKIWPGDHAFTKEMREEAYAFLKDKLCVQ